MRRHTTLLAFALLALGRGLIAQELKECAHFKDNRTWPNCLTLSPDAKMLATVDRDRKRQKATVKLWDVASSKEITTFDCQTHDLQAMTFSADGRLVAAAGYGSAMVWDVAARKSLLARRDSVWLVDTLAFSADGKRLGVAGQGEVRLWDVASGKELSSFKVLVRPRGSSAFSRDLRTLASPDYQEIDLWDVNTGKRRATLSEHQGPVWYVEYSRDGKTLVAASDRFERKPKHQYTGEIRLWDVATGRERAVFQEDIGYVWPARLSPDGKTLAALERQDGYELHLKLMDVATGTQRVVHPPPRHAFTHTAFTADGRLFVIGTPDHKAIKIWEVSANARR